jgi:hypothetical protein
MTRKKNKPISFDAMVKFFMQNYNIPTTKDIDKLLTRIERLENLVRSQTGVGRSRTPRLRSAQATKTAVGGAKMAASRMVLEVIKKHPQGVGFAEIQQQTHLGEKKLRNIIFRLYKLERIARIRRGVYTAT